MATKAPTLYINTHAANPSSASTFYKTLGFTHDPNFSDPDSQAFRLPAPNDSTCLMLHSHSRMKNWIRPGTHVNDAHTSAEKLLSVSLASREDVDAWLAKAVEAGGQAGPYVMDEFGATCGLYSRSFEDLDGHLWEVMCDLLKKDEP